MPTFYNFRQDGVDYSFDDVFVPADMFRDGNLWTWGAGGNGRLGNAQTTDRSTPVTTFAGGTNWKQVSCGGIHTAAIKTDGTLWVWGANSYGQLGNAQTTNVSTPVTTFAGGTNWKQVNGGYAFLAAIKTDGTLWTWGAGGNGRLGNAQTTNRSTPVTTFAGGTNWEQVSSRSQSAGAIKTDGTLWMWGRNSSGELGNAQTTNVSTPVTTFAGGTNWKQVACSPVHTSAIKTDGTLWTWGSGANGKLGTNDTTPNRSTPVTTFAGGNNWKQVSGNGNIHTAAIKTDGTLWLWGFGGFGDLGNAMTVPPGPGDSIFTPVTTFAGGTNWKEVRGVGYSTIAIKTDGTLWTWGRNNNAQLGTNDTTNRSTPVTTFAGGTNWKQVGGTSGGYHMAALTYDDPVI
jgi:alpha-tubulin suppressor-like RCC1 family protein